MVNEKDILRFQQLYQARFGIEMEKDIARRKLSALVKQMEVVYQPIRRADANIYVNGDVKQDEDPDNY